ncbi:MAG: sugar phosphate isomerase/epimerase [Acidobacteria bacterium]|nr:sugar phosphate isomerase/epimerase [Acidobacteriota bacterium]MCW5967185.1 sugar phosphate isomerase/epimerase [Blastocatellales bacterium]
MIKHTVSRRDLLKGAALSAVALPLAGVSTRSDAAISSLPLTVAPSTAEDAWRGLKAGVASYTLRKLPLDAAIKAIQRLGLNYVSIKDFHLPLKSTADERKAVAQKFKDAGITPLSCGNITMTGEEANIRNAFEYARDAGIPTIVCSPDPNSMPILDRMVKEFNIKLAIHNHGPEDKKFPSPHDVWKAIEKYDERIGFCIDVGHTARAGVDPAAAIKQYRSRLYDLHFKDINSTAPNGGTIEGGRGVLNLKSILAATLSIEFKYLFSFEYEKDGDDPVPGLAETIGYTRGLLAGMGGV